MKHLWTCPVSVVIVAIASFAHAQDNAMAPTDRINLLSDPQFKNFTHHLNLERGAAAKREEAWSIGKNGQLHMSGKGWGYLRTNAKYRNYHMVLEYQWGEHTWGTMEDAARSSGILLHAYGKDGTWMNSIESQLQEGASGDILVMSDNSQDGTPPPTGLKAEVEIDRDGLPVWTPGGAKRLFPKSDKKNARIYRRHCDPNWVNVKGYRGDNEVENPLGEWNRLEVICTGGTIRIVLNGELINEATDANPSEGYIGLQSEGAELFVRRYELWPLGKFKERWKPPQRSTNTGYSETGASIVPRRYPWSPEKSRAAWKIDGDYELQLVAAEPLVCDPVDVVWNEQGRMFVAEMRDYPLPTEQGPRMSRIRLLKDVDGDGRMDEAKTWADNLVDVQGMLCIDGGLLITCGKGVLFLKDTDGDGVSDENTPLLVTNTPQHNQLQIASPRWRLDNTIHFNNGIDGKEIHPASNAKQVLSFKGFNLRFDPRSGNLRTTSGIGQFGATLDDVGRVFYCSNRNPAMFTVLPKTILDRNPFANLRSTYENIQPSAAKVHPHELSHTTSIAHAGTHTSACGLAVYTGDWMNDLRGDLLVCDPTSQLVTRNRLLAKGSSLQANRVGDRRDFLVSADEWSRPVNLRNGPDGALYICDMYRRFIDHSIYFPAEFSKSNYMRAGVDHGRIWRLVPTGAKSRTIHPMPRDSRLLIQQLGSDVRWRRVHAQRLLVAQADKQTIPALTNVLEKSESPLARLHALWTLQGLHDRIGNALPAALVIQATNDADAGVVENALQLAADRGDVNLKLRVAQLLRHNNPRVRMLTAALHGQYARVDDLTAIVMKDGVDPWVRRAVLSISPSTPGQVLSELLKLGENAAIREAYLELVEAVASRGDVSQLSEIAGFVKGELTWQQSAVLIGLAKGLPRSRHKSLPALVSNPPVTLRGKLEGVKAAMIAARIRAADSSRPTAERIDALALAQGDLFPLVDKLIQLEQPPEIQTAACRALSRYDRNKVADFFFARWKTLAPIPRREALTLITSNNGTAARLMKKMKAGEVSKSLMPPMNRWVFGRSNDPAIKSLALDLFGQTQTDRAKVIADYKSALQPGDAERGRTVFVKAACANCHSLRGTGKQVGPDITDVRIKPPEALLADILDPNRALEERWTAYNVQTNSGQIFSGLIVSETVADIELATPGGESRTIARDQIESLSTTGLSLMPEGLEKQITKQQMSDLVEFLKSPLEE